MLLAAQNVIRLGSVGGIIELVKRYIIYKDKGPVIIKKCIGKDESILVDMGFGQQTVLPGKDFTEVFHDPLYGVKLWQGVYADKGVSKTVLHMRTCHWDTKYKYKPGTTVKLSTTSTVESVSKTYSYTVTDIPYVFNEYIWYSVLFTSGKRMLMAASHTVKKKKDAVRFLETAESMSRVLPEWLPSEFVMVFDKYAVYSEKGKTAFVFVGEAKASLLQVGLKYHVVKYHLLPTSFVVEKEKTRFLITSGGICEYAPNMTVEAPTPPVTDTVTKYEIVDDPTETT